MDYLNLLKDSKKKSIIGIVGATKGFGYTLLSQVPHIEQIKVRIICSRNINEGVDVLKELGYKEKLIRKCFGIEDVLSAKDEEILVVNDYNLILESKVTSIVECTGDTEIGTEITKLALKRKINVYMVSKETDSLCGAYFNKLAIDNDAVYSVVNGDQPKNLMDLYSWGKLLGLDIVTIGKSSEYDFVFDRKTDNITYLDGDSPSIYAPNIKEYWSFKGRDTLEERKKILKDFCKPISADLCEMNLVSNSTGFLPASSTLNYPIAKISELANIFIPKEDGGILDKTGVVDVFYQLRDTDEASFAGGVFIIVRCTNENVWQTLKEKGHIVSENYKYACIYLPYHIMGVESPITILMGDLLGIGTQKDYRQTTIMIGEAIKEMKKGSILKVEGHHHEIEGLSPRLIENDNVENIAPYYLLNNAELINDIYVGDIITLDDIEIKNSKTYNAYKKGKKL